jgi:uncharacterized protein (TIGR00369 family)
MKLGAHHRTSDANFQERIRESFERQRFMSLLGAQLVEIKPGYCEIHLPYQRSLTQQHGYFHAGVIGAIADSVGGYAAYSLMPADSSILTVEYKLNLLNPGQGNVLIACGYVVKSGRTLSIAKSEVLAEKGGIRTICATSLMTLIQLPATSDKPSRNNHSRKLTLD